ncbi:hypothetical protein QQX98_001286 [Neonectria punicea]|uniref:ABC transporter domain-containing protein n=1 Tax=Neonectria punicea TaxID=979145 RepID=A0ABR1HP99_9HYPO
MWLLCRQIWTLAVKDFRIILYRRWFSTLVRALLFPLLFVIFLSYAKNLFFPPAHYGIGETSAIRSLSEAVDAASGQRDRLVFINSGFTDGDIDRVISNVITPLKNTSVNTWVLEHERELGTACRSSGRGSSRCIAAAVFYSSPSEGNGGVWNYSLQTDGTFGSKVDTGATSNDAQIYTLPLQHAIDFAIGHIDSEATSETVFEYPFTSQTNKERKDDVNSKFMGNIISILAAAFYVSMLGVLYQLTGLMATERETGMAQLLDTMMPNKARWQPQAVRLLSHNLVFSMMYAPGWIVMGAVMGAMVFPETSIVILLVSILLCGFSITDLAIFFGCCFRKAQLSGITAVILTLVLAIVAQVSGNLATWLVVILSLLFPPMNYVYLVVLIARWESRNQSVQLVKSAPSSNSTLPIIAFWIFAILHTLVYPFLGALIETRLFGTTPNSRTTEAPNAPVAVRLLGFTKTYQPGLAQRIFSYFTKRTIRPVVAVQDLDLHAYRGEVMVLLGANGSGKSTTLDAIAGMSSASSGEVYVSYAETGRSFGHCPQTNVLWDELTVEEHLRIFDGVKNVNGRSTVLEMKALIEACDLSPKTSTWSKALSGGQKCKLQLALMFVGGPSVCCVDEVSSGVDPLSRRKLWDILLGERGRRTILLTTHFLDEADLLADRIAILSHGVLKACGTSVELKQTEGVGYRVHVHNPPGTVQRVHGDELHIQHDEEIVYLSGSTENTCRLLRRLEHDGVSEYRVDGPTLEDVFLKIADEASLEKRGPRQRHKHRRLTAESDAPLMNAGHSKPNVVPTLLSGTKTGVLKQAKVLLSKRFAIFRRNPVPYIVAIAIPIIAAGCCTLFLKNIAATDCDPDLESLSSGLVEAALETISNAPLGSVTMVDTLAQFNYGVQQQYADLNPGGFFLGDKPTIAWRADGPLVFGQTLQNLLDSTILNITIHSNYKPLAIPSVGKISDSLIFTTVFGLAMAVYPAFFGLYPTFERLRGIRGMHYSNGVHAYLVFDFLVTLLISAVVTIILGAVTDIWYHLEYLFTVFLLYGTASTLFAYDLSLVFKSQLAAFAVTAATQAGMFLVFFIAYVASFSYVDSSNQTSTLNIIFFTMGAIDVFGGPILYLSVQSLLLFGILLWKDSGLDIFHYFKRRKVRGGKDPATTEIEMGQTNRGFSRGDDCLEIHNLKKQFKEHLAVDDVSFTVSRGECFALLGPNGGGKTTCISLIRGDLTPTGRDAEVFVDGTSVIAHRAQARSKLGVCPQIDPLDNMTVGGRLRFYAEVRGIRDPQHNIDAIIQGLGLPEYVSRIATKLSGGNKRKLSLGIALMGNPAVLLLDEPSSGMDALSKRKMWRTLASVIPGRALVLTTHSMEEANALASRAGVLASKMLALGTTEELKAKYGTGYVAHLVHRDAPHTSAEDMEGILAWIQHQFPGIAASRVDSVHHGQARFEIEPRDNANVWTRTAPSNLGALTVERALAALTIERIFFAWSLNLTPSPSFYRLRPRQPQPGSGIPSQSPPWSPSPSRNAAPEAKPSLVTSRFLPGGSLLNAFETVEVFRRDMAPLFPFLITPLDQTPADLATQKPVLFMAIMVVASQSDVDHQLILAKAFREEACRRIFVDGEKNIGLLHGLLVYIAWYHTYVQLGDQICTLIHMAVSLVTDLGIDKEPRPFTNIAPGALKEFSRSRVPVAERTLEERRCQLGVFWLSSTFAVEFLQVNITTS